MFKNDNEKIRFTISEDDNNANAGIFDEKNNTILAMRTVAWGEGVSRLELRKWFVDSEGNENPNKGFAFLTEDGPKNLAEMLVDRGYGDTDILYQTISRRPDFNLEKKEDNRPKYNKDQFVSMLEG